MDLTDYQKAILNELEQIFKILNYKKKNEKFERDIIKLMDKH